MGPVGTLDPERLKMRWGEVGIFWEWIQNETAMASSLRIYIKCYTKQEANIIHTSSFVTVIQQIKNFLR